jgi:hypothetical protein
MASVGALLDHMVRERAAGASEDDGVSELEIRGIDVVALYVCLSALCLVSLFLTSYCSDQVMQINADALLSVS